MVPRLFATGFFRLLLACSGALAGMLLGMQDSHAHKPITSKYTYTEDVFPIFRDRCGRCHVSGGVAPMSLLTYKEAYPWAESIRTELISSHMPPWYADEGFGEFKNRYTLSARELDVILVWASGGTPQGDPAKKLPAAELRNEWLLGPPDLALPMSSEFNLSADKMEDTGEFTLPTGSSVDRWIEAVDLLPGTPAIVRDAIIYVRPPAIKTTSAQADASNLTTRSENARENALAVWVPGEHPVRTVGAAFRLPAGAELVARIHYKKTWKYEGTAMTDRSTVGLYFANRPAAQVRTFTLAPNAGARADTKEREATFSRTLDEDIQVLALRVESGRLNVDVQAQAILPDGARAPMIRLATRPDWQRRYWLERPVSLPRGSRIEVIATPRSTEENLSSMQAVSTTAVASADAARQEATSPLRLLIDFVPRRAGRKTQ